MPKKNGTGAVRFVCERFPEANFVLDSHDIKTDEKSGRVRPYVGRHVNFVKVGYPKKMVLADPSLANKFRGEYETSDPEEIAFFREHEWFGRFISEEKVEAVVRAPVGTPVVSGVRSTAAQEPQAPVDPPVPAVRGRVSKGLKRKPVAA